MENGVDQPCRLLVRKRPLRCSHLVKHSAGAIDVRPGIDNLRAELLRRHVRQSSSYRTCVIDTLCLIDRGLGMKEFCQTEIEYLQPPLARDVKIVGLQVAVDHTLSVSRATASASWAPSFRVRASSSGPSESFLLSGTP